MPIMNTLRCTRGVVVPVLVCVLGLGLASQASAERFVNRWTGVQLGAPAGTATPAVDALAEDWKIEPADEGFVRLRNTATGRYLNVERDLAVSAIEPGWRSAQWTLEPAGEFLRIRNRLTGEALNVEQGPLVATPVEPGWWSAQWQIVAATATATATAAPAAPLEPTAPLEPPAPPADAPAPPPASDATASPATAAPAPPAALPSWVGRRWRASSSTAEAITGDITTTASEIVFANGARLPWRVVKASASGQWGFSKQIGQAVLFEVTEPGANPELLSGNRLCGRQPVKYLSLWLAPGNSLSLAAFHGPALPTGIDGDSVCAVNIYGPFD